MLEKIKFIKITSKNNDGFDGVAKFLQTCLPEICSRIERKDFENEHRLDVDATTREYQPPEYSYIRRKLRITRLRLSDGKLHSSGWYVRV